MPTLIQSRSSMLQSYSYDDGSNVLTIVFSNGGAYNYFDVPFEAFNEMQHAESDGKYFLSSIKPRFKCEKQ